MSASNELSNRAAVGRTNEKDWPREIGTQARGDGYSVPTLVPHLLVNGVMGWPGKVANFVSLSCTCMSMCVLKDTHAVLLGQAGCATPPHACMHAAATALAPRPDFWPALHVLRSYYPLGGAAFRKAARVGSRAAGWVSWMGPMYVCMGSPGRPSDGGPLSLSPLPAPCAVSSGGVAPLAWLHCPAHERWREHSDHTPLAQSLNCPHHRFALFGHNHLSLYVHACARCPCIHPLRRHLLTGCPCKQPRGQLPQCHPSTAAKGHAYASMPCMDAWMVGSMASRARCIQLRRLPSCRTAPAWAR